MPDLDQAIAAVRVSIGEIENLFTNSPVSRPLHDRHIAGLRHALALLESLRPGKSDQERAREIAELAPNECGACGGVYPNRECGHLKNANYLAIPAPCRPITEGFVEAIAAALTAARVAGALYDREYIATFVAEYLPPHFEVGWLGKELSEAIRLLPPDRLITPELRP